MNQGNSKPGDAGGAGLDWGAANEGNTAFGPNDPAVELVNHISEFAMSEPILAILLSALAIFTIAAIFASAGTLMWYMVYLSQRLYGWGPHGRTTDQMSK